MAVSRDQDLAGFLRWAGEEIGVKAPKLKGSFVDGLRGEYNGTSNPFLSSVIDIPFFGIASCALSMECRLSCFDGVGGEGTGGGRRYSPGIYLIHVPFSGIASLALFDYNGDNSPMG